MDRSQRYLLSSALAAANTAYALRPVPIPGYASFLSLMLSWPTTELPLNYLAAQAAVTGVAVRRGVLRTRAGQAGLALSAASAVGLIELQRRGRQAAGHLEAALVAGLGPDYPSRILRPREPGPDAATARHRGVVRMSRVRRVYARDADISYGQHGAFNQLDICAPARPAARRPRPGAAAGPGRRLGYRQQAGPGLSPDEPSGGARLGLCVHELPALAEGDVARPDRRRQARARVGEGAHRRLWRRPAIRRDHRWISGGHLCALAALSAGDVDFQPGFEDADTTVQAAVPFYGIYDWTPAHGRNEMEKFLLRFGIMKQPYAEAPQLYGQASPLLRVGPHAPPFFVLHGDRDTLAPVTQARLLVHRLRRDAPGPVVYAELPGGQHAFDVFGSPRATAAAEAVGRFLGVVYGDWARSSRAGDR